MTTLLRDETSGNNRLILSKLETPRKLWSKGNMKHYVLEYQWLSASGGVQGNEFSYWSKSEAKSLLAAKSVFDAVNLF